MKYGLSFHAMGYRKTSEPVDYAMAHNTLDVLSTVPYIISSVSHCSLKTRTGHCILSLQSHPLFSTVSRQKSHGDVPKMLTRISIVLSAYICCASQHLAKFKNLMLSILDPNVQYWNNKNECMKA
jgi:hypothetical protein